MLNGWNKAEKPGEDVIRQRLKEENRRLEANQMKIKEKHLPVLVLIEGWGAAGKGSIVGKIIKNIDPRFFKAATVASPSQEEKRRPFLYRYFSKIPEAGKFVFLDAGWMEETVNDKMAGEIKKKEYAARLESIKNFERQLTDNGYLLVKFFFVISQKEQKKRMKRLLENKDTRWRVTEKDLQQNRHYPEYAKEFSKCLEYTHTSNAPWYLVDAADQDWARLQVLEVLNSAIETGIQNQSKAVPLLQNIYPMKEMPLLSELSVKGKELSRQEYKEKLRKLQKKLGRLHNRLYRKQVPVILVYEGWDAAGKGGNIKRITEALDPRGFEVHPIASPEPHEKARHYLWRFWVRLPKTGHIAIFDRSWYGRVMVERLEGFCTENDWKRAYHEINEFEKELTQWGAVLIKFWVQIDKNTQLERFTARKNTPEKQWKITQEDWRNREKWDAYEEAVNEMLQKTSTEYAPWHILESVDKKYARIKALEIVIREIEEKLK